MKAIEFQTTLHSPGTIDIPSSFQQQFASDQEVRVIVLIQDTTEDETWKKMAAKQFFSGYADEDSIYDNL